MNNNISKAILEQISNFIEEKFALYYTEEKFKDLMRSLSNASKQKDIEIEEYIKLILLNELSDQDLMSLVTHLTIGETYFFRDEKLFKIMKQKILPDIINSRKYSSKSLKIWSAGCSTGEEAYSIAILIKELIPDYESWNIKVVATDINENSISKAKKAIYGEWSFRGVDFNIKNKYFNKINDVHYRLKDDIVKLVKFRTLNLAESVYVVDNEVMNNIDIIFCRNVLMYFSKKQAQEIIGRFYNNIINGGWLVTAPSESLFFNDTLFTSVNINDKFFYKKSIKEVNSLKKIEKNSITKNLFLSTEVTSEYSNLMVENKFISKPQLKDLNINTKQKLTEGHELEIKEFEDLSRSFADEGKLEEALKWCKKAINVDKINPVYYHLLASIQQEQGNISEAVASLKKAIFLDSGFIMAYFDLGNLNLKQKRYKEAFKSFGNAFELLNNFSENEIIPHSEQITVGMLRQTIENIVYKGDLYGNL